MNGYLQFLGTGSSVGVPSLGCPCAVCSSPSPYNKRLRSSALIHLQGKNIVIDAGPDFRCQMMTQGIKHVDGIILTHAHQDHVGGLDDVRPLCFFSKKKMPLLLSAETLRDIMHRFSYLFEKPQFQPEVLPNLEGSVNFQGIDIQYTSYRQAGMTVNGFRLGSLAYLTDLNEYEESIFEFLKGVDQLVISALRFGPSDIHLTIDQAVEFANKVGSAQTWLTHLSHDLDYEKTNSYLPQNVRLAYDGLKINFHGFYATKSK